MDEEREGPEAAPRSAGPPYPDRDAAARRRATEWRRTTSGRNKQVVTPRGVYASAAQAADAYGYSRSHASWLARHAQRGWRWFVHGIDEGQVRTVRADAKNRHRPAPPHARRVTTPAGTFDSATLAALAHGISRQSAARRARMNVDGWSYDPSTAP